MGAAEEANDRILRLWGDSTPYEDAPRDRWPLLYGPLQSRRLLFVGLNPGFNVKWLTKKVSDPEEFYRWRGDGSDVTKRERIREIGQESRREYGRYFGPIGKIADEVGRRDRWEHVDIFAVRETSQGALRDQMRVAKDEHLREVATPGGGGNPFARKQIDISEELIRKLEPEVVIVVNALASKILRIRWDRQRDWREYPTFREVGYHKVRLNGRAVPVLFSGMVGGQRSLDRGSRERLIRQIWKALGGRRADS